MGSAAVDQAHAPIAAPVRESMRDARCSAPAREGAVEVVRAQVRSLRAEVSALLALDPGVVDGADGPALHAELRAAVDQLSVFAARVLARVEADGRWEAGGERTFGDWMARRHHASTGSVRRDVALGRALDGALPGAAAAVASGSLSLEHAQVLARVAPTSAARLAALAGDRPDTNEAFLLARAATLPVDRFRAEVQRWAARVDADAAEREHERAAAKEYLTLSRRDDGVVFQGFLTHEHGAALETALRAVGGVPAATDHRSKEERQAAALVDAARLVLDKGLCGGGQSVRPHITVHVSWDAMERLAGGTARVGGDAEQPGATSAGAGAGAGPDRAAAAELAIGRPLPASVFARIACDSEISRVVFGPEGDVLDVGRAHRTYTGQQRRAVIARDRSCRFPGCGAPVMLGEVHHVASWAEGGPTSIENGILLCWHHHDLVHRRRLRIARLRGTWVFRSADGQLVDGGAARGPGGAQAGNGPQRPGSPGGVETPPRVHEGLWPNDGGGAALDVGRGGASEESEMAWGSRAATWAGPRRGT